MLWWFLENTLAVAGLSLVVCLVCRLVRFRPAVEHALWLLIVLKLLTPAWLAWPRLAGESAIRPVSEVAELREMALPVTAPAAVLPTMPVPAIVDQPGEVAVPMASTASSSAISTRVERPESEHRREPAGMSNSPPIRARWAAWWTYWWFWSGQGELLLVLWAAGALLLAGFQLFQTLRFRRRVLTGQPAPELLSQQWGELAVRLGVRPPVVKTLTGLASPLLWCLGRPKLLWPSGLEKTLDTQATQSLLVHELAHLRRRDHWVAWLELVAMFFWWWNPLFWYVRRRLGQSAEMACDAWVVWALPDAQRTYAESLVTVREWASGGRVVAPAWGALGEVRNLERRLTMIFRNDVRRELSWSGLVAILLLALVILPGWSRGEEKKAKEPTPAPIAENAPRAVPRRADSSRDVSAPASSTVVGPALPSGPPAVAAGPSPVVTAAPPGFSSPSAVTTNVPPTMPAGTVNAFPGPPNAVPTPDPVASPSMPAEATIRVFPLKHRDPDEMISIIRGLWGVTPEQLTVLTLVRQYTGSTGERVTGRPGFGGGPEPVRLATPTAPMPVRLVADPRTKSLIARGSAELIERIAKVVAATDTTEATPEQQVEKLENLRAIPFKHRSLEDMTKIVESLGIPIHPLAVASDTAATSKLLIATGPDKDLAELEQLIQSLDVEGSEPKGSETKVEPTSPQGLLPPPPAPALSPQ